MHNALFRISIVGLVFGSMTACATLAPDYARPAAPVPAAWPGDAVKPAQKPVAEIPWREFFVNPQLQQLIALSLQNNRDLRVAALTIERFQAQYQIRRSDLLPKLDVNAAATFQRIPATLSASGRSANMEQYSVGLGIASYELDLFGRVRSLKDQALQQYLATEQARRSIQISLISQVATAWLALAADRERLKVAQETLTNQQDSYRLIKSRFDAGVSNSLALNQAQTTLDAARVDTARFTTLAAQDVNALDLIVGSHVPAELLPQSLSESLTALKELTPGLPSEVLLVRPDILQAEDQLKAFNATIGAARAAFFPRITLVSSVGLGSDDLAALFQGGALAWKFAPQITLPIFDAGSNQANLKVAEVDRAIAVAQYEKAIQNAFREVADALVQQAGIDEQLSAQQSLTDAAGKSFALSQARFDSGVDSYLTVLDSQRSLYSATLGLINTRLVRLANLVTLYKALGGGTGDYDADLAARP